MKHKYLVLDFGNVIAGPSGIDWDITPKFLELINQKDFDFEKFNEIREKYTYFLGEVIYTLDQEYDMFYRYYNSILSKMNYDKSLSKEIAYNRTYTVEKYKIFDTVKDELELLKDKYTIIMLSDNWPCVYDYLKDYDLYKYFDNIYISSEYGFVKEDGLFFDYMINDYDIKKGEALFIDDNEHLLDVGVEKGLDVMLMDRYNQVKDSNYIIINNLYNMEEKEMKLKL